MAKRKYSRRKLHVNYSLKCHFRTGLFNFLGFNHLLGSGIATDFLGIELLNSSPALSKSVDSAPMVELFQNMEYPINIKVLYQTMLRL
uniref:Uncharacterized protein n=1 Tax=Megaselia scalaris TaxID=36166 RepID=T1GRX3_MEGSC